MEKQCEFLIDWRWIPREGSYKASPSAMRSHLSRVGARVCNPYTLADRKEAIADLVGNQSFADRYNARSMIQERMAACLADLDVSLPSSSPLLVYDGWDGRPHAERRYAEPDGELIAEPGQVNFFRFDKYHSEILDSFRQQGLLDRAYLGYYKAERGWFVTSGKM